MADVLTKKQRRHLMQSVRRKDTEPEMVVRKLLHGMGYRYRLHRKDLPGSPDIVFPSRKKVIFVHGCFWHGHDCNFGRPPSSRRDYWIPKLKENKERDAKKCAQLEAQGWDVLIVWQCYLQKQKRLANKLSDYLNSHQ